MENTLFGVVQVLEIVLYLQPFMKKALKYCRIIFAAYLALYMLCNAAFLHNHIIDGQNISHAHIFTGAEHSASEAQLIQFYNTTSSLAAEVLSVPQEYILSVEDSLQQLQEILTCRELETSTLRGPPALLI